jgi:hypothetical protein
MKKEKEETIKQVVNKIQWVQEYVDAVGEEHKDDYVHGLEWAMKELMNLIEQK